MTIKTKTFGCRLNIFESQIIEQEAKKAGLEDTLIINTCAVTNEAVRQARQAIRKAKRQDPNKKIIVTGCAAQIDPDSFAQLDEVDYILGNEEKLHAQSYKSLSSSALNKSNFIEPHEKIHLTDIMDIRETIPHMVEGFQSKSRAFVQIQNGCDHRCTFCIIPFGRGNSRSAPMGFIVEQIQKLLNQGYREVILTGVDLTSYGSDLPAQPKLGDLVEVILRKCPDLLRLRLSSLDSVEIDDKLMEIIISEQRLMPYIHLSLQHGDNLILKRMKRRHNREQAIALTNELKISRPDIIFGADIIAGFPTETEEHFENSLALVDDCQLTSLHVFPFSPRPGTPAARMPQLEKSVIQDRAARLRQKGETAFNAHMQSQIGRVVSVLIENDMLARTEDNTAIKLISQDRHKEHNQDSNHKMRSGSNGDIAQVEALHIKQVEVLHIKNNTLEGIVINQENPMLDKEDPVINKSGIVPDKKDIVLNKACTDGVHVA